MTTTHAGIVPDIERCIPQCGCAKFDMFVFGIARCEITLTSDNDDRTRAIVRCLSCDREWYACRAKRLADQADENGNREAWGPVGVWGFSEKVKT